jgi:hypothetical protein
MRPRSPRSSKASQPSKSSKRHGSGVYREGRGFGSGALGNHPVYSLACALRQKAVFSSLENRLCLGVLIGRQRFRTHKIFDTHGTFRSIPRVRATGPAILRVWRRTHRVTQMIKQQNLEAGQSFKGWQASFSELKQCTSRSLRSWAMLSLAARFRVCPRFRVRSLFRVPSRSSAFTCKRPPQSPARGRYSSSRRRLKEKSFHRPANETRSNAAQDKPHRGRRVQQKRNRKQTPESSNSSFPPLDAVRPTPRRTP